MVELTITAWMMLLTWFFVPSITPPSHMLFDSHIYVAHEHFWWNWLLKSAYRMVPVHSTPKRPEAFWGCSGRGIYLQWSNSDFCPLLSYENIHQSRWYPCLGCDGQWHTLCPSLSGWLFSECQRNHHFGKRLHWNQTRWLAHHQC